MSTSTLTRNSGSAAPCGCSGGTAGKALAIPCSCGGAGCTSCQTQGYVRPRFFAGQLLTEDDLQALSDYVLNKNRLYNRHFMGDGVVCGLQVTCNPCGGGKLIVQPGHALDCCGNDLVLECAVELDAIAMVRDLRRNLLGGYDCGDPCADRQPNGDKRDQTQRDPTPRHYCLYLRYSEESSDPVAPYATDEPCGPAGCETTRVIEGVRFELRCRDETRPADGFLQRAQACLSDLTRAEALSAALAKLFNAAATPDDFKAAKEALLDLLDAMPQLTDCRLRADLAAIAVPLEGASLIEPRRHLVHVYVRLLRDCICRAVLPPCPPCDDIGVLLACIELADCKVIDICNLERKFVLTAPTFRYWFPVNLFGDLIERLCCSEIRLEDEPAPEKPPILGARGAAAAAAQPVIAKRTSNNDTDALLNMVSDHVLKTFGLTERDGTQLNHIALNLSDIFSAGALDDLLPARVLRGFTGGLNVKETLSGQVVDSAAFRSVTAELDRQHATKLEAASQQLRADNAKTADVMAKQNTELRSQLGTVMARLNKLEGTRTPPASPGDVAKKPRK
jgi:hypothetical protein